MSSSERKKAKVIVVTVPHKNSVLNVEIVL